MREGVKGGCRPVEGNGPDQANRCHKLYGYKTNAWRSQEPNLYYILYDVFELDCLIREAWHLFQLEGRDEPWHELEARGRQGVPYSMPQ